ncbi:hypothetical protein EJ04DRAFT_566995 [Polyplosphaeria fusca]|uniref:MYND-type domain-containing protein n=1 Tax=Polyplosphaeria fusca TaxID=682080 RepID=A0A9P4QPH1_9PLEO|nr:hypothetical protein EJ04DRAFT_566995 [Polyplosphaeria fusca]
MAETPEANEQQQLCCMCNAPSTIICDICKCSRYCSTQCQKDDSTTHKLACNNYVKLAKVETTGKIDEEDKVGDPINCVYFPEEEGKPRFITARLEKVESSTGEPDRWLHFEASAEFELKDGQTVHSVDKFARNPVLDRQLTSTIMCLGRAKKNSKGKYKRIGSPNKAVTAIDPDLSTTFVGPLLFYSIDRCLDTNDFRHIIDYIGVCHWAMINRYHRKVNPPYRWVWAVQLHCEGDRFFVDKGDIEVAKANEAIVAGGELIETKTAIMCPVMEKLQLPIVFDSLGDTIVWRGRTVPGQYGNRVPATHNRSMTKISPGYYGINLGNVMAARKDKRPLLLGHIDAIALYCSTITDAIEFEGDPNDEVVMQVWAMQQEQHLLKKASKKGFLQFFASWMRSNHGKQFGTIPSPYNLKELDTYQPEETEEAEEAEESEGIEEAEDTKTTQETKKTKKNRKNKKNKKARKAKEKEEAKEAEEATSFGMGSLAI